MAFWDVEIKKFIHSLIPHNDGKEMVKKVVDFIKANANSRYAIDRDCFAGSQGKRTTIEGSDFDCVLFVNNVDPPFKNIAEEFKDIILGKFGISISKCHVTDYSVQFCISIGDEENREYYNVDIVIGANYVSMEKGHFFGEALFVAQRKAVMLKIEKSWARYPEIHKMLSSSLAETQVEFFKKQDSNVHDLVRLAKYWLKTLTIIETYPPWVKSMIEMLAVHAAQRAKKSFQGGFILFLLKIVHIKNARIVFRIDDGKTIPRVLKKLYRPGSQSPLKEYIPEHIRHKGYFVLDPANPYNDLTQNLNTWIANKLIECAKVTMSRFNRAYHHAARQNPVTPPDFAKLFAKQ